MIYSYLYIALQKMKDIYISFITKPYNQAYMAIKPIIQYFKCNIWIWYLKCIANLPNRRYKYFFFKYVQFHSLEFLRPLKVLQILSHQYLYANESLQIQLSRKFSKFFLCEWRKWMPNIGINDGNAINYCQCNVDALAMHTLQQRPRIHDIWLQSTWQTQLIPNLLGTGWQSTHWALSFWGVSWWSV